MADAVSPVRFPVRFTTAGALRASNWKWILGVLPLLLGSMGPCLAQGLEAPVVVIRTLPGKSAQPQANRKVTPRPAPRSRTAGVRSTYRRSTFATRRAIPQPRVADAGRATSPSNSAPRHGEQKSVSTTHRKSRVARTERRSPVVSTSKPDTRTRERRLVSTRVAPPARSKRSVNGMETRSKRMAASPGASSPTQLNAQGYALIRRGRYAEAETPLRAAVRSRPNYAYALYNLGCSLLGQGKAREAVDPLRESAALQPNRWEPLQKLAEAYAELGNRDMAFETRARARELRGSGDRRGRRTDSTTAVKGPQMAVHTMLGENAWVGSTNRREDQYLQERQEWRLQEATEAIDKDTAEK